MALDPAGRLVRHAGGRGAAGGEGQEEQAVLAEELVVVAAEFIQVPP